MGKRRWLLTPAYILRFRHGEDSVYGCYEPVPEPCRLLWQALDGAG